MAQRPTLSQILDGETDLEDTLLPGDEPELATSSLAPRCRSVPDGCCVECEERVAVLICFECEDAYCAMCFGILHRRGNRREHARKPLSESEVATATSAMAAWHAGQANVPMLPVGSAEFLAADVNQRFSPAWFRERAKYIPVRLSLKERKLVS